MTKILVSLTLLFLAVGCIELASRGVFSRFAHIQFSVAAGAFGLASLMLLVSANREDDR